jgi:hypothetical protein
LVHLQKASGLLNELMAARARVPSELSHAPWEDGDVKRLITDLTAMSAEICEMVAQAEIQPLVAPMPGDDLLLLSRRSLEMYATLAERTRDIIEASISFYQRIAYAPSRTPSETGTSEEQSRLLDQRDAERLRLLNAVYFLTDGDSRKAATRVETNELAGLAAPSADAATNHLHELGLIFATAGRVRITPAGVQERERALRDQGERTSNFSAAAVQYVFHIANSTVGVVQTGASSSVENVTQSIHAGVAGSDLAGLLQALQKEAHAIPETDRVEAVDLAKKIERQAAGGKPLDLDRLKKYLDLYISLAAIASPTAKALAAHFGIHLP